MSSKKGACKTGKVKYPSEKVARKTARFFTRSGRAVLGRPYFCKHCGTWHNTSRINT
jgi:predicted Zn-ribbon and HTH transcriptional regulator